MLLVFRPDRDQYVKIFPENIENGKSKNFEKREKGPEKNQVVYIIIIIIIRVFISGDKT